MPAIRHDEILLRLVKDVNDIRSALRRVAVNLPLYDIANENTPNILSADQNNYVPGNYDILRLESSGDVQITGIRNGVKGRSLQIFNVGATYSITLAHQSASSDAQNRFDFGIGANIIVGPGSSFTVYYDSAQSRWIESSPTEESGIAKETTPAKISSDVNDYSIADYSVLRLSTDANRTITGMSGGIKGRKLQIFNVGLYAITLANESASSTAENRFNFSVTSNVVVLSGSSIQLYYDYAQRRWIEGFQLEESGISKETTPTQITADQNDYDASDYNSIRLSSDATRTITGISGGVQGRKLRIFNVGSYAIFLSNNNVLSAAENRFSFSNGRNALIAPGSNTTIYYDDTQLRWIGGDFESSGRIVAVVNQGTAQSIPNTTRTKVDPGSVIVDQYGFYDDANNRFNILYDGLYFIRFIGAWDTGSVNDNHRMLNIDVNVTTQGNSYIRNVVSDICNHECSCYWECVEGDTVEFYAEHANGSALDFLSCTVTLERIA